MMKKILTSILISFLFVVTGYSRGYINGIDIAGGGGSSGVNTSNSVVLAPSPVNDYILSTDGVTNKWVLSGTGSGYTNVFTGQDTTGAVKSTAADIGKYLKADGSWDFLSSGYTNVFTGQDTTGAVKSTAADVGKYLKADGSWDSPSGGASIIRAEIPLAFHGWEYPSTNKDIVFRDGNNDLDHYSLTAITSYFATATARTNTTHAIYRYGKFSIPSGLTGITGVTWAAKGTITNAIELYFFYEQETPIISTGALASAYSHEQFVLDVTGTFLTNDLRGETVGIMASFEMISTNPLNEAQQGVYDEIWLN